MLTNWRILFALAATMPLLAAPARSQDSPSLGDVARQQRKQSKATPGKDAKPSKVITNEEIPEHDASDAAHTSSGVESSSSTVSADGAKQPAEHWKSQIQSEKGQIASLQKQIAQLNESIRFAPANCVGRCVEWNERQREKLQQVERMQTQLDAQKKHLDEMQESARKQGYGSSVYDP
jgi:chromosome segregation ATPase